MDDKVAKQSELDEQKAQIDDLQKKMDELDQSIVAHDEQINKCVTWDQLDDSFKRDFFNEEENGQSCEAERKDYPNYFKGLETLSDYGSKIDDLLREFADTSKSLNDVKEQTGKFVEQLESH